MADKEDDENFQDERWQSPMQIFVGGECVYDPDDEDEDAPPTPKKKATTDSAPAFAVFNGSIKMKMLLRKGTPGIYAGAISSHPEKELLLRHGQQFRVLEYEEKSDVHYLTLVAEI